MNKKQQKEYNTLVKQLFDTKELRENGNLAVIDFCEDCVSLAGKLKEASSKSIHHKALIGLSDPNLNLVDVLLDDLTKFLPAFEDHHTIAFELYKRFDLFMDEFLIFKAEVTSAEATNATIKNSTDKMRKRIEAITNELIISNNALAPLVAYFALLKNKYNSGNN